jgi:hypothetical protein
LITITKNVKLFASIKSLPGQAEPLNLGPRIVYNFSISTNCLRSQAIDGEEAG